MDKAKFFKATGIVILVWAILVLILWLVPIKALSFFLALFASIIYFNSCFVSYCTSLIERKYDSNYDVFYRILFIFLACLFWTIFLFV